MAVIVVTRLNGPQFGVNPDLLLRIDSAPDTILTLIDGTKYIVEESMAEVIDSIREHRAQLLARAQDLHTGPAAEPHGSLHEVGSRAATPAPRTGAHDAPLAQPVPIRPRGNR
ncbi:flagellar FlbD family protein [Cellulomonas cellasea]|uniref:Flagellar protein FlbD n=1 Tax=Cellulomonas cellasea TaxID=43670 RepID=A0A7W4UHD2_9CELL|nr:flagellar FlbD family protein [Cellulomonas cellasea]MBB2924201.1 flagellar protein FlbD [Cellulomonas cellasea]